MRRRERSNRAAGIPLRRVLSTGFAAADRHPCETPCVQSTFDCPCHPSGIGSTGDLTGDSGAYSFPRRVVVAERVVRPGRCRIDVGAGEARLDEHDPNPELTHLVIHRPDSPSTACLLAA